MSEVRESSKVGVAVEEQEAPIHGDILEAILSHVPLIDLVQASHVSKAWKHAVISSLRQFIRLEPWLIVHRQTTRGPYSTTTHAYDPRSHVCIEFSPPSIKYTSTVRSSDSSVLYTLSSSKLSFSFDPLHLTWHHAGAPQVWRVDPIVALVGRRVVVAGGTCEFEDDPLAVEIYDVESRKWDLCESMPAVLKDSAASTWISVAGDNRRLFVKEKHSSVTHTFDPETKSWRGPYNLRPDSTVFYSVIAYFEDRLILIGLTENAEKVEGVKLWGVNCESFECESIGEMPQVLVEKLKSESSHLSSIGVCLAGNIMHVYNPSTAEEIFVCEFVDGGCRWGSVRNVAENGRSAVERVVFTSSKVGIHEVHKAMRAENRRFTVEWRDLSGESQVS